MKTDSKDFLEKIIKFFNWAVYAGISLTGICIIIIGWVSGVAGNKISFFQSIIIGSFSILFAALSIEKWKQQFELNDKLNKIQEKLENLQKQNDISFGSLKNAASYTLIKNIENIREFTLKDIDKASDHVRATSFKFQHESKEDKSNYYELLGKKLKENVGFRYSTAYNKIEVERRKKSFNTVNLGVEQYKRIRLFKFGNQLYQNILIVDDFAAYIGFPTLLEDENMQIALRVSNDSKEGAELIKRLIIWYEKFIPECGVKENPLEVFNIKIS